MAKNWITNSIAISALVISIASLLKSCEANKIAKTAELPYFKFSLNFANDQDEIRIHNEGGKIRELENPEIYLFWSIRSARSLLNAKDLVVINYYNLGSRDPLLTGKTPVTISAGSPSKAKAIIAGFRKLAKDNNILVFVSAKKYIRLRYKDIYEEPHDDMYEINPMGSKKISKNEAVKLIRKYNQKIEQSEAIDISTISPEILYEKWHN